MTAEQYASDLANLRRKLGVLEAHGGISKDFVEWHGHLMASLTVITREFPGSAGLCEELRTVDYELRSEIESLIPEGLPKDQIIRQGSRMFFKKQCDHTAELLRTLGWSLNMVP